MTRTFLIPGTNQATFNSPEHDHQTVMGAALNPLVDGIFRYDPIEEAKLLSIDSLRDDVLGSLAWYTDNMIRNSVTRMLADFYNATKLGVERTEEVADEIPTFADYDAFTKYIEGIDMQEETLHGFGVKVQPRLDTLGGLLRFRNEIHGVIASDPSLERCRASHLVDGVYYAPNPDLIFNEAPKLRGISAAQQNSFQQIAQDEIKRAKITDVDKAAALTDQIVAEQIEQQKIANINALGWDRKKATALQQLWVCVSQAVTHDDDDDVKTFAELDAVTQYTLLGYFEAIVMRARAQRLTSTKLKLIEKGTMRVEVIALLEKLDVAVTHPRFADL